MGQQTFYKTAAVFGGTGFVGRQIVRELAKQGYTVKVVTRAPERAYFLKPCGGVGQIVPFACDYSDDSIRNAVKGCDAVVISIGSFHPRRRGDITRMYVGFPQKIARACAQENVQRLVHITALGCEKANSKYGKAKTAGEQEVRNEFPAATILRPSVIFGPEDNFFNMFAEMARYVPALPLIGGGRTRFQPVYVGDVADAALAAILRPPVGDLDPRGKSYDLGGPEVVTMRDVYERVFKYTRRRRALVTLPWSMAKMQAVFMGVLPKPPLTPDQVETLKTDTVVGPGALTLADLGIAPTGMNLILPGYLTHYAPGGRFGDKKRA